MAKTGAASLTGTRSPASNAAELACSRSKSGADGTAEALDDLVASGLLYGSNYPAWKTMMDAKLRMHDLDIFVKEDRSPRNERFSEAEWARKSHTAANIICIEIAPDLLVRVPENEIKDPKRLMSRLRELTTRFRFLDLPVELRNRIYECIIDSEHNQKFRPKQATQSQYPAITKASMQLRQESLPIMYSRTTFWFNFTDECVSRPTELTVSAAIEWWAKKQIKSHLKLLRTIIISTDFRTKHGAGPRPKNIMLSFSKAAGFTVTDDGAGFNQPSQKLFEEHVKSMQSICNMCSVQGEILVVALIGNPGLWKGALFIK